MNDSRNPMAARTKVAVYNHTNDEQGAIVDGEMVSVPAGDGMGGAGMRMVTEAVAEALLEALPGRLARAPKPLAPEIRQAVEKAGAPALRALVLALLEGRRPASVPEFLTVVPKGTDG